MWHMAALKDSVADLDGAVMSTEDQRGIAACCREYAAPCFDLGETKFRWKAPALGNSAPVMRKIADQTPMMTM